MKSNLFFWPMCLAFGIIMISCGGDDDISDTPSFPIDTNLEVQMRVGSETLQEGGTYTINETTIEIETARFYLGNISLTNTMDTVPIEFDNYYIVSPENNSFSLGTLETDDYGFSFGIGVDPENNDQTTEDFTTRPSSDPLGAQEPAMHWNWNSGYKFMRIDAIVDTDADGIVDTAVQYHLGSDPYFSILSSTNSVEISSDNDEFLLRFDLEQLLDGVDIATGEGTHVMDNVPMAETILSNYTKAFSIRN